MSSFCFTHYICTGKNEESQVWLICESDVVSPVSELCSRLDKHWT